MSAGKCGYSDKHDEIVACRRNIREFELIINLACDAIIRNHYRIAELKKQPEDATHEPLAS